MESLGEIGPVVLKCVKFIYGHWMIRKAHSGELKKKKQRKNVANEDNS